MKLSDLSRPASQNPRIRARWCATLEARLTTLPARDQELIEACVEGSFRAALDDAGELGWIPAELFVSFVDAVLDVIGDERFFDLYHSALLTGAHSPLLQATSTSAIHLFGPRGMVLAFVPAWELFAWDCARIRVGHPQEDGGSEAMIVEFAGLPSSLASSWAWASICQATLQATLDSAGLDGTVEGRRSLDSTALRFFLDVRAKRAVS